MTTPCVSQRSFDAAQQHQEIGASQVRRASLQLPLDVDSLHQGYNALMAAADRAHPRFAQ